MTLIARVKFATRHYYLSVKELEACLARMKEANPELADMDARAFGKLARQHMFP
jgi:hypothetical protein